VALDELILHPGIWRGRNGQPPLDVLATGFTRLDRYLPGGGWPLGVLTEIFLDRYGIGELSLLTPACAQLSRGEDRRWILWVAPPYIPYAPALARHGVDLDRLLVVHSAKCRDRLWAIEQALRSGSCAALLAWISSASGTVLRRLQLIAEEKRCWVVLFRPSTALRQSSPAPLRLRLLGGKTGTLVKLVKCRGAAPGMVSLDLAADS
jgi:hypothetical protein